MWQGREGRAKATQGRRGGSCLGPGASGGGAGSGETGEMGASFGANGKVGGSEGGEGGPEEARREGARMATGSRGSPRSLLGAKSLGSPGQVPSLAFAIWLAGSGTTPGEKAFSVSIQRTWKCQLLIVLGEFLRLLSNGGVNLGTSIRGTWRGAGANRLSQSYKQRPLTKHCTLYCVGICCHKQRFETNWLAVVEAQATEITKSYNRTLDTIWNIHKLLRSVNVFICMYVHISPKNIAPVD